MIQLEVIKSPDTESLGEYQYVYYPITVGSSDSSDLILKDQILERAFKIDVIDRKLVIDPKDGVSYFHNGLKVSKKRFISEGDQVRIGQTILVFKKIDLSENEAFYTRHFDERVMEAEGKTKGVVEIIDTLEQVIIDYGD